MASPRGAGVAEFPEYAVAAYVRGGRFAAVSAVLAVLHARGIVQVRRPGSVALVDIPASSATGLEWAIKHGISGNVPPRALATRPAVEAALASLRQECRRQGFIRPWLPVHRLVPVRTRSGRRLLADLRKAHARPLETPTPHVLPAPEQLGMLIALYGAGALRTLNPEFGARSGLLGRRSAQDVAGDFDPDAYNTAAGYYGL